MPRITAPASKLARTLAESQRAHGAILTPKYAELLGATQQTQHTESRSLKTTHRPTPQPSIAGRTRPLMQGFHSSTPSRTPTTHVDTTVLPKIHPIPNYSEPLPRMPLLPDNYGAYHHSMSDATDLSIGHRPIILAIDPDVVVPGAPMAKMDDVNIDGIDVKFVHQQPTREAEEVDQEHSTFLRDMYRSVVDDLFGPKPQKA